MLADDVKFRGHYSSRCVTHVDKKNAGEHRQCNYRLYTDGLRLIMNAIGSIVAAVARRDSDVQQVDEFNGGDDGRYPIYCDQHEHGSDDEEKPFPWSTSESIGTVSSQKSLRKKGHQAD
jgi:hypothetical protein